MATTISTQDIIDVKRDINDIGKAVNEKTIVSPRYGEDFKSLPMIALEAQGTIDEWETAVALITQEGGVPALAVSDASGETQQELNDRQARRKNYLFSIFDFDNSINAVYGVDTSSKINAVIQDNETTNANPYLFFPAKGSNYQLNTPLVFRKAVPKILGQLPANYDRYPIDGWFLVNNTECGFDLGASESTHTGGSWTLENIGFKPASADLNYVADGVRITSARNAPERGYTITEVSAARMKYGIYVKNSANFMAATMDIKNCNLSGNDYAFYADQKVDGLRFVGNQAEQNRVGGLKIRGAGSINISDNMLEGQPNAIEIDGWSVQSGTQAQIIGNYFEANYGDFLISFKDTSYGKGVLEIENNEIADLGVNNKQPAGKVIDFCRIYNNEYSYGYTILNREAYPVTFMDDATVLPQSILCSKSNSYYIQKDFNGNFGSKVFTDNFINLGNDPTYTNMTTRGSSVESFVNTQFGTIVAPLSSDYLVASINAVAGDVITVNILFRAKFTDDFQSGISLSVRQTNETVIQTISSARITQDVNNKYILGTYTFKMPSAHTNVLLRIGNTVETGAIQMLAGCFKNLGQFLAPLKIRQVLPRLDSSSITKFSITQQDIAANATRSMSYTITGAKLSDFIAASYSKILKPSIDMEAYVAADNTVTVNFKNTTASTVTMSAGDLLIKRSRT